MPSVELSGTFSYRVSKYLSDVGVESFFPSFYLPKARYFVRSGRRRRVLVSHPAVQLIGELRRQPVPRAAGLAELVQPALSAGRRAELLQTESPWPRVPQSQPTPAGAAVSASHNAHGRRPAVPRCG